MSKKKGTCLECGTKFSGRRDKKFCDDTCRAAFNNRKYKSSITLVRQINRVLAKNRKILEQLNPEGTTRVRREVLLQMGFNFHYNTNLYETREGKCYYFCYDYGYIFLTEDLLALVIRKDYVTKKQTLGSSRDIGRK